MHCVTCKYFEPIALNPGGRCHCHAPEQIAMLSIPMLPPINPDRVFCYVPDRNIDWCGEYEPKTP
jgi:hypothetical protein